MSFAVLRHKDWDEIDAKFFKTQEEAINYFKSGAYGETSMVINSLGKELRYWGVRQGRDKQMKTWWENNHLAHLDLELHITNVAGDSWSLRGDPTWSVWDLKGQIEQVSMVPAREQRLLHEMSVFQDYLILGDLLGDEASAALTLIRRDREIAKWLAEVQAQPSKLGEAPARMREDAEIVMAAAAQDDYFQFFAAPSLLADAAYVYNAIRQRGGPTASELSAAPTAWLQTPADAKLALRAAALLPSQDLAAKVLESELLSKASEEERVYLAAEPMMTPAVAKTLLEGITKRNVQNALQKVTLENLALGVQLLEIEASAPSGVSVVRAIGTLFSSSKPKVPVPSDEVLEPPKYVMSLILRHADHLRSENGAEQFKSLFSHLLDGFPWMALQGTEFPSPEACRTLIRLCLFHGENENAQRFFMAGIDDSEETVKFLSETSLPLTILEGHRCRSGLLTKILNGYGGSAEILAAVANNRDSLQTLLRNAEGDATIGRHAELSAALKVAADLSMQSPTCSPEASEAGRVLFRCFATASPPGLPDFEVPLRWFQELRGVANCAGLVIEQMLQILEGARDEELRVSLSAAWTCIDWEVSTSSQMTRALAAINRLGLQNRQVLADLEEPVKEMQRMEQEGQLSGLLNALPLVRLDNAEALCMPGMPSQAVSLLAFQKAAQAEERARRAEDRAAQVEATGQELRTALDESRREAQ
eukprot:TRINITY_DN58028_c0_g1_i1.p1 TRINITY_DN58028_c0_g1~~TRINITY_DN58028_c0_g1_i1.p1  ORF type:complete len:706 (+),score=151.89 TRINITY_DN58028_c0_g1_i1:55-2172(+)